MRGGVLAGRLCVGTDRAGVGCGGHGIEAQRLRVVGQCVGAAAQGDGAVADGVGCLAGSQCVVPFHVSASIAVGTAAGLEVLAGGGCFRRDGIQLCLVHRIGGLRPCGHVGHLAFVAGSANRHAAVTISHRACTQRDRIAAAGIAAGTQRDRAFTAGHRIGADGDAVDRVAQRLVAQRHAVVAVAEGTAADGGGAGAVGPAVVADGGGATAAGPCCIAEGGCVGGGGPCARTECAGATGGGPAVAADGGAVVAAGERTVAHGDRVASGRTRLATGSHAVVAGGFGRAAERIARRTRCLRTIADGGGIGAGGGADTFWLTVIADDRLVVLVVGLAQSTDGDPAVATGTAVATDGDAVIAHGGSTRALGDGTGADRVAGRTGGHRTLSLGKRTGIAAGFRLGLEVMGGGIRGAGHGVQLRLVHCIGGFTAGSDAGDLPLVAGTAHGDAVVTDGFRVGAQGDTVGAARRGVVADRRALRAAGPGLRAQRAGPFSGCVGEVADGRGFGAGGFGQAAVGHGPVTAGDRAGTHSGGGFAAGLGLHEEAQAGNQVSRATHGHAAGAGRVALGADCGGVVADGVGHRAECGGLRAGRIGTHAIGGRSEASRLCAGTDRSAADAGTGRTGLHRHAAVGDERIAVLVHGGATHRDAARSCSLRVVAERGAVLSGGQGVVADRRGVLRDRGGAGADCGGAIAERVGRFTGSQRVIACGQRTGVAVAAAGGLETLGRGIGHGRDVPELADIGRIGVFGTRRDTGDLPGQTVLGRAHRYRIDPVGQRAGAQRHTAGGNRCRVRTQRGAVFTHGGAERTDRDRCFIGGRCATTHRGTARAHGHGSATDRRCAVRTGLGQRAQCGRCAVLAGRNSAGTDGGISQSERNGTLADDDAGITDGQRVLAERTGAQTGGHGLCADGRSGVGQRLAAAADRNRALPFDLRRVAVITGAVGLEVATALGCRFGQRRLRGPRLCIQLRLVHRIGCLGASGDVGHLPFLARITDGNGIGTRCFRAGAQRHAVGTGCTAAGAHGDRIGAGGRGAAIHQALVDDRAVEHHAVGVAADLHRLCRGDAGHAQSQCQRQCGSQYKGPGLCRIAALVDDPAATVGRGQFRGHDQLTQCFVPDLAINPIHRYGS